MVQHLLNKKFIMNSAKETSKTSKRKKLKEWKRKKMLLVETTVHIEEEMEQ
jgi:hypothetical protein